MSAPATGPNRKSGLAGAREAVGLLDADPDLGAGLTPERREEADALVVHAEQLGVGAWQVARVRAPSAEYLGLLLLDGVISRELIIADTVSVELPGPGDLIRPWPAPDRTRLLRVDVRWWVLSSTSVAVLDRRVAAELAAWPEIMACLLDRLTERSERLAITQAISQLTRVDRRLLTLFWHLAERWGRVGTDGVLVPLALTHRMLGQLVGARRPTVPARCASATSSSADLMARGCCAAIRRRSRARRDSPSRTATRTTCCDPPDSPAARPQHAHSAAHRARSQPRGTPARRSAVDLPPDGSAKIGAREAAPISEPVAVPAGHELGRAQRGAPATCMSGGSSRDVRAPPNRGTDPIEALGARLNTALT